MWFRLINVLAMSVILTGCLAEPYETASEIVIGSSQPVKENITGVYRARLIGAHPGADIGEAVFSLNWGQGSYFVSPIVKGNENAEVKVGAESLIMKIHALSRPGYYLAQLKKLDLGNPEMGGGGYSIYLIRLAQDAIILISFFPSETSKYCQPIRPTLMNYMNPCLNSITCG